MYLNSIKAMFSAARSLLSNRRALLLMIAAYAGLLFAIYLFVSTREATIFQLILTLVAVIAAPALFFILQAVSVSYTSPTSRGLLKKSLKLIAVSVPVIALTLLMSYGLNKVQTHPTMVTGVRYLLLAVITPLLAIQLWIAGSNSGLRVFAKSLPKVLSETFAPQSMFVYTCGFLIFAIAPYYLLQGKIQIQRPWLEFSLLILRLGASALLILLGWVTTVGAISILSRPGYVTVQKD